MNGHPAQWAPFIKFFEHKGYDCKAIDLNSGCNLRKTRFNDFVEKVKIVTSEEDILIGHSMGGLIVQKVAEKTCFKAGICICPAPPNGISINLVRFSKQLIYLPYILFNKPFKPSYKICKEIFLNGMDEQHTKKIYDNLQIQSAKVTYELAKNKIIVDESKIKMPLLFIARKNDKTIPLDIVKKIADKYNAELKIYPGNHYIFDNWQPIAEDILKFIKKL
jgi:pimeloyl-ACP methyl ester carboxylesterase